MATSEERMRVLQMVADGTISASDGVSLLEAMNSRTQNEQPQYAGSQARWFRVRVTDLRTGKDKVNINIPIGLVNVGLKMGARFVEEDQDIDFDALAAAVQAGQTGRILDVEDLEDNERVQIFVE
ncbi:MAG: hypothetical protein J5I90_06980 [Caldilineales bacterium]|nr:hypothetical protein [Caldilineales bacterium]